MNNNEARAYAALAMEKAGIPAIMIGAAISEMWDIFDKVTEEQALDRAARVLRRSIGAFEDELRRNGNPTDWKTFMEQVNSINIGSN